jgi:hypothetical protein
MTKPGYHGPGVLRTSIRLDEETRDALAELERTSGIGTLGRGPNFQRKRDVLIKTAVLEYRAAAKSRPGEIRLRGLDDSVHRGPRAR